MGWMGNSEIQNGPVASEAKVCLVPLQIQGKVTISHGVSLVGFSFIARVLISSQLLVETLLSQRLVLESNHHPFYSVQAFMDKNAYSEWVITEKEKIDCLIRSFWHNACPPVHELPLEDHEFHKQYVDLMKRLIR